MNERLIGFCDRMPFPLKEFIERTLGPGRVWRNPWIDRSMRHPPHTPAEDALDLEQYGPARVAVPPINVPLVAYEALGGCVFNDAALARVDFQ